MKDVLVNPTISVSTETSSLTPAEKHQILAEFNDTKVAYPHDKTVIDLFEEQARLRPHAVAVVFEDQQLTYKELNEYSNQLAHYLRSKGVKEETLVPICIERSLQMIIGILAVLKAGAAYVPIDSEYPEERIRYILEDTGATIAISSNETKLKLQNREGFEIIELDATLSLIGFEQLDHAFTGAVKEKMEEGPITGSYARDVRVMVYDGKMHPVDSNDISFKIAGMMAFKDAFLKSEPQLLEPIYDLEVMLPEDVMGEVMGDLQTRRSLIMGMDSKGNYQIIKARTPLAELDRYSTTLRSLSQGRARFTQKFAEFAPVPFEIQQKLAKQTSELEMA